MARNPPPYHPSIRGKPPERDSDDRGVSEVVSFILTFSIITMMVGILYTAGFVSLQQLQTGNQMQNAEGVFFAMADSFGELQEGQAPKRAGSLDLDVGASITVINDSQITVTVNNGTDPVHSIPMQSLDYRLDERAVTYETGAVFRSNQGGSAMIREPSGIFCGENASVISVVKLEAPNGASVASGTATITGIQQSSTLLYPGDETGSVDNVTIDVTSPHETAWNRYLETGWNESGESGVFVCDVGQVFVRKTVVEVQIIS